MVIEQFLLYGINIVQNQGPVSHPGYRFNYNGVIEGAADIFSPAEWAMSVNEYTRYPHRIKIAGNKGIHDHFPGLQLQIIFNLLDT